LCSFLARTYVLWHKQFATRYIERYADALTSCISFVNKDEKGHKGPL
jgi:hypothetical protein